MLDTDADILYNHSVDWKTLLFTMTKIDAREVYQDDELPLEFCIPTTNTEDTYY